MRSCNASTPTKNTTATRIAAVSTDRSTLHSREPAREDRSRPALAEARVEPPRASRAREEERDHERHEEDVEPELARAHVLHGQPVEDREEEPDGGAERREETEHERDRDDGLAERGEIREE